VQLDVFGDLIETLDLSDGERDFLRSRWLKEVRRMEAAAQTARNRYHVLRLTTIVGAVIVAALVGINTVGKTDTAVSWLTFSLSLVVALSAAIEGFFSFGEQWNYYRRLVGQLEAEGWQFIELAGPYGGEGMQHKAAFRTFVERVTALLEADILPYVAEDKERGSRT
jgi:uncharacterized protein DUF4231